jgi:uncharacterized protein (TIGR02118 family)
MATLVALYKTPKDLAAFDRYYFSIHVPLAKTIPGLMKYEISDGGVHSPDGASGHHLVALLHFDSVADIQAAFASPEGQAIAADLGNFSAGWSFCSLDRRSEPRPTHRRQVHPLSPRRVSTRGRTKGPRATDIHSFRRWFIRKARDVIPAGGSGDVATIPSYRATNPCAIAEWHCRR